MIPALETESAVCAQVDPALFDSCLTGQGGASIQKAAKRLCNGIDRTEPCPIRQACLEYALANDERYGVWGGLGRSERVALARERGIPVSVEEFDDEMVDA